MIAPHDSPSRKPETPPRRPENVWHWTKARFLDLQRGTVRMYLVLDKSQISWSLTRNHRNFFWHWTNARFLDQQRGTVEIYWALDKSQISWFPTKNHRNLLDTGQKPDFMITKVKNPSCFRYSPTLPEYDPPTHSQKLYLKNKLEFFLVMSPRCSLPKGVHLTNC